VTVLPLLLLACTEAEEPPEHEARDSASEDSTAATVPECEEPPRASLCGNAASLVQGVVTLPDGEASGDLVVALMHRRHGSPEAGGHPHWFWEFEGVAISSTRAFEFTIDMCEGSAEMWSEENCEYNLVAILDADGDNGWGAAEAVPDPGEPSALATFELSCHADGPTCVPLRLGCMEGAACVRYESPGSCGCSDTSCPSEAGLCW
jgi:hypothetical protein